MSMEPKPPANEPLPQVPPSGFTTMTLVLIPVAIAINIAMGQLVTILKLPIYLDSIGTVLVGALSGPIAGLVAGALTNIIWSLLGINPYVWPFFYVAAVIGLLAGFAGDMGLFVRRSPTWLSVLVGGVFVFVLTYFVIAFLNMSEADGFVTFPAPGQLMEQYAWATWVFIGAALVGAVAGAMLLRGAGYAGIAGLFTGLVAAVISAPTAAIVFGGVTGSGTDLLVAAFRASGANIMASTLAQGAVSDPFDKMASFLIVWMIVQALPMRMKWR